MLVVVIMLVPKTSSLVPLLNMIDYEETIEDIPVRLLKYYFYDNETDRYYPHKKGDYFKDKYGNFIKFNFTYSNETNSKFYRDPYGCYTKKIVNNITSYYCISNLTTPAPTPRTVITTARTTIVTKEAPDSNAFQNLYMKRLIDSLPPLEKPINCTFCPRIYIPVCGSDGRSYTNVCKMSCMNRRKSKKKRVKVAYMGICAVYADPYHY